MLQTLGISILSVKLVSWTSLLLKELRMNGIFLLKPTKFQYHLVLNQQTSCLLFKVWCVIHSKYIAIIKKIMASWPNSMTVFWESWLLIFSRLLNVQMYYIIFGNSLSFWMRWLRSTSIYLVIKGWRHNCSWLWTQWPFMASSVHRIKVGGTTWQLL